MDLYEILTKSSQDILQIKMYDLTKYYLSASEDEFTRLLPLLRNLHQYCSNQYDMVKAAHLNFLIAHCYLIPLCLKR